MVVEGLTTLRRVACLPYSWFPTKKENPKRSKQKQTVRVFLFPPLLSILLLQKLPHLLYPCHLPLLLSHDILLLGIKFDSIMRQLPSAAFISWTAQQRNQNNGGERIKDFLGRHPVAGGHLVVREGFLGRFGNVDEQIWRRLFAEGDGEFCLVGWLFFGGCGGCFQQLGWWWWWWWGHW